MELQVSLSGSSRADYLAEQLAPFLDKLPNYTEIACALGGAVFKPYVSGDRLLVDVVQGDCFFPTTFDTTGRLTGAIFSEQLKRKNTIYTRLERHEYAAGVQTIQNKAFASSSTASLGQEIPLTNVPEWADIAPEVRIEVERPLFAYFRIPLANRNDRHSPLGASVYAPAVDTIHDADEQFGRLLWEYEGGQLAIDVDAAALRPTGDGPNSACTCRCCSAWPSPWPCGAGRSPPRRCSSCSTLSTLASTCGSARPSDDRPSSASRCCSRRWSWRRNAR